MPLAPCAHVQLSAAAPGSHRDSCHPRPVNMYLKEVNHRTIYRSADVLLDNLVTRLFDNWTFLLGPLLTIPLFFVLRILRDEGTRPLVVFVGLIALLNLFQMVLYPFHLGPIVPAIFAIVAAGVRQMSRWALGLRYAAVLPVCV